MAMQYATAQGLTIPTFVSTDSKTPTTPVNPVVTISKDGAALAAAAGVVTVIADYGVHVALTAADMTAATIGVKITSDNCDPVALSLVTEAGYTAAKAAFLDASISSRSTYAGGDTAGTTTLLERLTALRAGYIDNLNIGGLAASAADVAAITQASRVRVVVPQMMERPDAGSKTFPIYIYAYDAQHQCEDLDGNPVVSAENDQGVSRSANLSAVSKETGTGIYKVQYTVASVHAVEALVFKVDATEGGNTTQYASSTIVVDTTAVDFTASDRAMMEAIKLRTDTIPAATAETGDAMTLTAGERTALATVINASTIGAGDRTVTVTVTDGTDPQAGVAVTITNATETTTIAGPLLTDDNGHAVFHLSDGSGYRAVPRSSTWLSGGAADFTVDNATAVTCAMTAAVLPTPAPANYCTVYCLAETQSGATPTGATFAVTSITSPTSRTDAGEEVTVVLGADKVTLVDNRAELVILQGAVVSLRLRTANGVTTKADVTIPAAATANWETLE